MTGCLLPLWAGRLAVYTGYANFLVDNLSNENNHQRSKIDRGPIEHLPTGSLPCRPGIVGTLDQGHDYLINHRQKIIGDNDSHPSLDVNPGCRGHRGREVPWM
jgi:hypothetical protein